MYSLVSFTRGNLSRGLLINIYQAKLNCCHPYATYMLRKQRRPFQTNRFIHKVLNRKNFNRIIKLFRAIIFLINSWLRQYTYDTRFREENLREFSLPNNFSHLTSCQTRIKAITNSLKNNSPKAFYNPIITFAIKILKSCFSNFSISGNMEAEFS